MRVNIRHVTDAVLESLDSEKNYEEKVETLNEGGFEDDIFPDFSDMVITGHGIKVPQDWIFTDFPYDDDQEIFVFPLSPYENSQLF